MVLEGHWRSGRFSGWKALYFRQGSLSLGAEQELASSGLVEASERELAVCVSAQVGRGQVGRGQVERGHAHRHCDGMRGNGDPDEEFGFAGGGEDGKAAGREVAAVTRSTGTAAGGGIDVSKAEEVLLEMKKNLEEREPAYLTRVRVTTRRENCGKRGCRPSVRNDAMRAGRMPPLPAKWPIFFSFSALSGLVQGGVASQAAYRPSRQENLANLPA